MNSPVLHTVTFNADGGSPAPEPQSIAAGDTVTKPPAMTKTNFTFDDWYKQSSFETKWDFAGNTITGDTTIYAKWTGGSDIYFAGVCFNESVPKTLPCYWKNGGAPIVLETGSYTWGAVSAMVVQQK